MALADTYKRPCASCERSVSMAYQYCPWCAERLQRWRTGLELIQERDAETVDEGHGRSYNGP